MTLFKAANMYFTQREHFCDESSDIDGHQGLYHCLTLAIILFLGRSPFVIEVEDPQRDLLDPAVKGTSNVLKSVAKYKDAVRRTVVTSSVAGAICLSCTNSPPRRGLKWIVVQRSLGMKVLFHPRMGPYIQKMTGMIPLASRTMRHTG